MADATLVQGAGMAAGAKGAGGLSATEGLIKISDHLSEGVGKVVQRRNQEFNKLLEAELANAGNLTDEKYKQLEKSLEKQRLGFVYMNRRGKVKAMDDLNKLADELETDPITPLIEKTIDEVPDNTDLDPLLDPVINGDPPELEDGQLKWNLDKRTIWALEHAPDEVMYNADGKPYLLSYPQVFYNKDADGKDLEDPRFTVSEDGLTRKSIHGHIYPNTEEGLAIFSAHAESDWQLAGGQALDFTNPETLEKTWYKSDLYNSLKDTESWAQGADKAKVTAKDMERIINQRSMDTESQTRISGLVEASVKNAEAFIGGDATKTFNFDDTRNTVMNSIINNKDVNLRSLAEHNIWGGTSWKDDLDEALSNATYEEMGIELTRVVDEETIFIGRDGDFQHSIEDPNNDGDNDPMTMNAEDRKVIIDAIMKDENLLKETLGDYYTKIIENNYNSKVGNNNNNNNNNNANQDNSSVDIDLNAYE